MLKEHAPNEFIYDAPDQSAMPGFQPDSLDMPGDGAKLPVEVGMSQLALSELTITQLDVATESLDVMSEPSASGNTKCDSCDDKSVKDGSCA